MVTWDYTSYNLAAAAPEADWQSQVRDGPHKFEYIQTLVRNESRSPATPTLTQSEVNLYNHKIFDELRHTGWFIRDYLIINRGTQNVACVGGCVVVPGGVWGEVGAGRRGLFGALLLAVAIVLMIVC